VTKLSILIPLILLLACEIAWGGETITAQEVESYFYADGKMKHGKPQFEITYYIEGDTVTRTRVYDLTKKEVLSDNTVYHIQRQLWSDPTMGSLVIGEPIIRAIGQPGGNAVEILVIGETFIQSVKSMGRYFVIMRLKRMK